MQRRLGREELVNMRSPALVGGASGLILRKAAGLYLMVLCITASFLDPSCLSLGIVLVVEHAQKVGSPHTHGCTHELHKDACET